MRRRVTQIFTFLAILLHFTNLKANISLIVDEETQKFLEELTVPIIEAADLDPRNIKIYIVNDPSINAFVTMGQNIFINTGLIMKYKTPDSLIGVIAHEVGHIASSHIARSSEAAQKAEKTAIAGYVLGVVAMLAGSPEVAQSLLIGGTDFAQKSMLKYSRSQEEAADKNALTYLRQIKYPSDGLITLLEFFDQETRGFKGQVNEYMLSHPVSRKRIDYLKNNSKERFSSARFNRKLQPQMTMVNAKLEGFMGDPYEVIKKYKNNRSRAAKYASAVAYYRSAQTKKSLAIIDVLIASTKNNGFFYELKAQILYESGSVMDSILVYKTAVDRIQGSYNSQSRIYLSQAVLNVAKSDPELINFAIDNLLTAKRYEGNNPFLYRQLYFAYGKNGNKFLSHYNYANYNYLIGDVNEAHKYVQLAQKEISADKKISQSDKLKLEDLAQIIKNDKRLKEKNKEDNDSKFN